jgi:hypothetical protein
MADRTYTYKVKQVPATATEAQIQTKLNEADTAGYDFVWIFTVGATTSAKFFAVFRKVVNAII